jgi:hypothetical protein
MAQHMPRFYQPDLGSEPDCPFARDANNKLVRRGYWLDMNDSVTFFGDDASNWGASDQR